MQFEFATPTRIIFGPGKLRGAGPTVKTAGKRPLVVSYSSSPAAEVDYSKTKLTDAPTSVVDSTCFGSVEFAGVLKNAKHPDAAQVLVDYLAGATVQADIPSNMYVYPVRTGTPLPESFTNFRSRPG